MNVEEMATMCHEVNRLYCEATGDDSQVEWDEAPEWQKESAIAGVQFHLSTPNASASASHDSWLDEKKANGWVYGEVKDVDEKTHPCIMPFRDLPLRQQVKDHLFKNIVKALRVDFTPFAD